MSCASSTSSAQDEQLYQQEHRVPPRPKHPPALTDRTANAPDLIINTYLTE